MNLVELLDRPIAFHRCFVDLTGSVTAGLMLSQAVYWQRRQPEDGGGWWFQSREKWTDETGLTREEQETARKRLRSKTFWKEELRGLPAKLYYYVDFEELEADLKLSPTSRRESRQQEGGNPSGKEEGIPPTTVSKETKEETNESAVAPVSEWQTEFGLEIPEALRSEECSDAIKLWLDFKREKKSPYKRIALKTALKKWSKNYTKEQFVDAVESSIASNYAGLFPATNQTTNGHKPHQNGSFQDRNSIERIAGGAEWAESRERWIEEQRGKDEENPFG